MYVFHNIIKHILYVSMQLDWLLSFSKSVFSTFQIRFSLKYSTSWRYEFSLKYQPVESNQKDSVPYAQFPLKWKAISLWVVSCRVPHQWLVSASFLGRLGKFKIWFYFLDSFLLYFFFSIKWNTLPASFYIICSLCYFVCIYILVYVSTSISKVNLFTHVLSREKGALKETKDCQGYMEKRQVKL